MTTDHLYIYKTMRRKLFILLLLLLIITDVLGNNVNKTKSIKAVHKNIKQKENKDRIKRSLDDSGEKLLIPDKDFSNYGHALEERGKIIKIKPIVDNDAPFWGTRGRRDSSEETVPDVQLPTNSHHKYFAKNKNFQNFLSQYDGKLRRDDVDFPFWGNRGRRDSDESNENDISFWANRGRRQDDEPFWGTRGRREEISPFWGNRGRRMGEPDVTVWTSDDEEPFWGNRGRRQDTEPFWGNRGRRETFEPFWGSRGKKKTKNIYFGKDINEVSVNRDDLRLKLKYSLIDVIDAIQNNLENLSRNRRAETSSFWTNRGRDSKLKSLFNGNIRNRFLSLPTNSIKVVQNELGSNPFAPKTVHDDRIFADEPRYIVVERSSRSSGEDDPFYISRGKKYGDFESGDRGRRGALEEIVKSVRNDPYYIARGKKDANNIKSDNSTTSDQLYKAKELVCSTVDLLMTKLQTNKIKRDINENERDRRTILKKLALQLQMDPYFVSRGKKNDDSAGKLDLEEFINKIMQMCN